MIERYKRWRDVFVLAGIFAFIAGMLMLHMLHPGGPATVVYMLSGMAIGNLLIGFVAGCAFWARGKGQSALWGLAGLLTVPGLVIVALLRDRNR